MHDAHANGVADEERDDGYRLGGAAGSEQRGRGLRDDKIHLEPHQFGGQCPAFFQRVKRAVVD